MVYLRKISAILIVVFVLILLLISFFQGRESKEEMSKDEIKKKVGASTIPVVVYPAKKDTLVLYTVTTGITRGKREAEIVVEVSGKVVEKNIEEGQFVRKGDVLLKLDDTEYRVALDEANARLIKAQVEFGIMLKERGENRIKNLPDLEKLESIYQEKLHKFQKGEIPLSEMDEAFLKYQQALIFSGKAIEEVLAAKSGLTEAFTAYKRAWLNLQRCTIKAPFSGVVGDISVEPFEYINSGQLICKITDLSRLKVEVNVLESDYGKIKPNANALVEIPGTGKSIKGKVIGLSPFMDREKRIGKAIVEIPGYKGMKSGMEVKVKIETERYPNLLLVPREALLEREGKSLIFVVREGEAIWNYVTPGRMNDEWVEIKKSDFGLEVGEPVIVKGHYTLAHKAKVNIVEEK